MNKKLAPEIVAGIDIGSHSLRMKIAQINYNGKLTTLEQLKYPVSLGIDTFKKGKVSFTAVDNTCEILKGFKKLLSEYKVKTYRIVATSAIREAENKDYILDQIKLKTGLKIDLINNTEEIFLTYKAIRDQLPNYQELRKEGLMILDLGSGSISVSIYNNNMLNFCHTIKLGSLRLHQVLLDIKEKNLNYPKILAEYIAANIDRISVLKPPSTIKNLIVLGGNTRIISKLCHNSSDIKLPINLEVKAFEKIYEELLDKSLNSIHKDYNIPEEEVKILLPSLMLLKKFIEITSVKTILTPFVTLRDGIICDLVDKKYNTVRNLEFIEDIVSSARFLAERYLYDKKHSQDVEEKAMYIYDTLRRIHGLGKRERLLLKLAAILHDTGKYMSFDKHYVHSYNNIIASELMGISEDEIKIIANVARYHSTEVPKNSHTNFNSLSARNRVIVAKLVAIIRMADALDRSHTQKISNLKIELQEKELIIKGESVDNTLLEEWTFETKSEFFQEVFGIKPILKIKRVI